MTHPRHLTRGSALVTLLVLLAVLLPACGAPAGRADAPPAGPPAPDFGVATIDGEQLALAQQRGRPVLLFFMAAWCTTCIPVAQDIDRLTKSKDAPRDLVVLVVGVDTTETPADLAAFRQRAGGPARHWAIDSKRQITKAYGVTALDTTVIIDRQGQIAFRNNTKPTLASLTQQVSTLR